MGSFFWNIMFDIMDFLNCETFNNFIFWIMDIEDLLTDGHFDEIIEYWLENIIR